MKENILKLLFSLYNKEITPENALEKLKFLPFQDINHTKIDCHREIRTDIQEIIFGKNKSVDELIEIVENFLKNNNKVLITKLQKNKGKKLKKIFTNSKYYEKSRIFLINNENDKLFGNITVITAGTSDIPVAEEAVLTAKFLGSNVFSIYDAGVAGIHRLLEYKDEISKSNIIIAIAGMEGALPSVIAGIFGKPIVAVPTSVGYGVNFKGIAPLLTMLNSCAPGITVVNIDNGFGAGVYAHIINSLIISNY